MDNVQAQNFFEHIEVAVAVQKSVAGEQIEGGNPTINGLTDGEAALPQTAAVFGSRDGLLGSADSKYL
jgi:hypothetical protein